MKNNEFTIVNKAAIAGKTTFYQNEKGDWNNRDLNRTQALRIKELLEHKIKIMPNEPK